MKVEYVDVVGHGINDGWSGLIRIDGHDVPIYKTYQADKAKGFKLESEAKLAAQQLAELFPDRVIEELVRTGYLYTTPGGIGVVRAGAFIALGR